MSGLQQEIDALDAEFRDKTLTLADRADLIMRRRRMYLELHPDAIGHGGVRRGWGTKQKRAPSFTDDTVEKLGISERTVRRLLQKGETL